MPTGACGINCTVCKLHVLGACSSCGAGNSDEGKAKLAAQIRDLGAGCPILACAVENSVGYCLRDCEKFGCEHFSGGPYPYAQGFLHMQQRRRNHLNPGGEAAWPETTPHFWHKLDHRNHSLLEAIGARELEDRVFEINCLNETWSVDISRRTIRKVDGLFGGEWDRQAPFLILVYLAEAQPQPLSGNMTAPRELVENTDFFRGTYELKTDQLVQRFGKDADQFATIAKALGAEIADKADVSAVFEIFAKVRVEYLLWESDEEFPARVNILADSDTIRHYPPDATAVLINLLSRRLLMDAGDR